MFSIAYVILPVSDTPPAEAIRASMARFQCGKRADSNASRPPIPT